MKLKKEQIKNKYIPLLLPLLFISACFIWIYFTYGVYYLSNDDTGIMKAFSGYSTGTPNPYHQYGSLTLGMIYKFLYTIVPAWNWYSYFSIIVMIVSNSVVIYTIYKQRDTAENKLKYIDMLIIGLITVSVSLYGIALISWTINAAFAAEAGMMLIIHAGSKKDGRYHTYICALLLMIAASLIRSASYKAILPFAMLALLYPVGNGLCSDERIHIKKDYVVTLIVMIMLVGIMAYGCIDKWVKAEEFPSGQNSFEYYRGLYTDYPHITYEGNEEFYESIGWDQEFYKMVGSWMFIDPRFNIENLKKIAEKSTDVRGETSSAGENYSLWNDFVKQTQNNKVRIYMTFSVTVLLVFSFCLAVYKLLKKEYWFDWAFLAMVQIVAVAEWIYLLYEKGRFIDRAFYCAAFPALYISMWIISKQLRIKDHYKRAYLALGIFAIHVLCVSSDQNLSAERTAIAEARARISYDADKIYFNNQDKLYIYDSSIISGTSLFLDMDLRGCGNNALMWGGTGVFSKTFFEKIKRFGYEEFYSNNLFDEKVYYITTDADVWNSSFMQYMRKCYGESVDAELMESTEAGVCVYKFIR